MRIRRRNLRKGLIAAGCLVGSVGLPWAVVGGVLLAAGSGLHFWSKACLEQNRRLTTAGPYRWTRNPFYLANLAIDVGLCLVIGRLWVAAVYLPIWWLSYRETIAREEARLAELFPGEFPAYRDAVPVLVPTGRRLSRERASGGFSLDNDGLARGSEYARLLGIWIAPFAVFAAELLRRERLSLFDGHHDNELALLLVLPASWVLKLGLAETFRRPQTALVPWSGDRVARAAMIVLLAGLAVLLGAWNAWLAVAPGLWCGISLLDLLGERRLSETSTGTRAGWRYFPALAAGSIAAVACVAVLSR